MDSQRIHPFSAAILQWYQANKRKLPWRETKDPYIIWLSEVILQQTRVEQGLPYFYAFLEAFPSVHDLANAQEEKVLRLWQGLGYYNRARNLHQTAKKISTENEGVFPTASTELMKLKGIGTYTAAAIASFAHKEAIPVIDGNVMRVLARFFGIEEDLRLPSTIKQIDTLAWEVLHKEQPDEHNQAIMEFGALQCSPKKPNCLYCPLQTSCTAFQTKRVERLPFKSKAIKKKTLYLHYVLMSKQGKLAFLRRPSGTFWEGLYEFPNIALEKRASNIEVSNQVKSKFGGLLGDRVFFAKHELSHRSLHCSFYVLEGEIEQEREHNLWKWCSLEEIEALPKPIIIAKFLKIRREDLDLLVRNS